MVMLADENPFFNYENNADCEWLIVLPDTSKVLYLYWFYCCEFVSYMITCLYSMKLVICICNILSFQAITISIILIDIEDSEDCIYDALDIYEGSTRNAPLIGRFCGETSSGHPLISETSSMLLHFHSDPSITGAGFWLTFNTSAPNLPECANTQPVIFEGTSGTIDIDVNLSHASQVVRRCHWKIIVPRSEVRIDFASAIPVGMNFFSCHADENRTRLGQCKC